MSTFKLKQEKLAATLDLSPITILPIKHFGSQKFNQCTTEHKKMPNSALPTLHVSLYYLAAFGWSAQVLGKRFMVILCVLS